MTLPQIVTSPHLRRHWRGALRRDEVAGLSVDNLRRLRAEGWLPPMVGAAVDPPADPPADPPEDPADPPEDPPEDTDDDDEPAGVSKAEHDAMKRRLSEADREKRALKKQLDQRRRSEDEEAGEYERLYKESQAELAKLRDDVATNELNRKITETATRLNFRNPSIAVSLVTLPDGIEPDDEREIEKAVKRLAKREGYLLKTERPQGREAGRGDDESRRREDDDDSTERDDDGRTDESKNDRKFGVERLRDYHARVERERKAAGGRT